MSDKPVDIDICVATYKRPDLLKKLLDSLLKQECGQHLTLRIIVVDNDREASARDVVEAFQARSPIEIVYDIEQEQNISLARNRAMTHARGDYIAFIDDDEIAAPDWIENLLDTAQRLGADVVFGPVLPQYTEDMPDWIIQGRFFERPRYDTGAVMPHGATNNVMLKRELLGNLDDLFLHEYGLTGGGDTEFFMRVCESGARMLWCDSAIVYEHIPVERMTISWLVRRAYRGGLVAGRMQLSEMGFQGRTVWFLKRSLALMGSTVLFPLSSFTGKPGIVRAMRRIALCSGQLSALTRMHYYEYKKQSL